MRIYGAGMAGLLAANMLRRFQPVVHEVQANLPNNHNALLRFRTDAVARATGIPFRRVRVNKGIFYRGKVYSSGSIFFSNLYSKKVTGRVISRSIDDLTPVDRFIAPDNFIAQMAKSVDIRYSSPLNYGKQQWLTEVGDTTIPCISTIPLPNLVHELDLQPCQFSWRPIWSLSGELSEEVDVYQTLFYPDPSEYLYRASITGRHFTLESTNDPETWLGRHGAEQQAFLTQVIRQTIRDFGMEVATPEFILKRQEYGKILPVDDYLRKELITQLTMQHQIYSLGRFATWRQILLDDVVHDVEVIERLMLGSTYDRRLTQ